MESAKTKLTDGMRKVSSQQIIGILVVAFFTLMLLLALGIVPSRQIEENPPPWIVVPVYGMFLFVGVFLVTQYTRFERYTGLIMAGAIVFGMGMVLNWGAFGPGYRECSRSISVPFLSIGGEASDTECRVVIGYFALLLDSGLVIVLASRVAVTFGDNSSTRAFLYISYGMLMLLLLPFGLLIAVIMLLTGQGERIKAWLAKTFGRKKISG